MYDITTQKISAPVGIYDLQQALGSSDTDLGMLCRNVNVRLWAKWKPVVKAEKDTTNQLNAAMTAWKTDTQLGDTAWWRGTSGNYGIDVSNAMVSVGAGLNAMVTALRSIISKTTGGFNGWAHEAPSGGNASPFRLTDFLGYNHLVDNPVKRVRTHDVAGSSTSTYNVPVEMIRTGGVDIDDRDYIIPEDITVLRGTTLHLGFAILKQNGQSYEPIAWVTDSSDWIGIGMRSSTEQDGIMNASGDDGDAETRLRQGIYYIMPFFATGALSQPSDTYSKVFTSSGNKLLTVPNVSIRSFRTLQRQTTQMIAFPRIENRTVGVDGSYQSAVYLDTTSPLYSGTTGTAINVRAMVVNDDYTGGTTTSENCKYDYSANVNIPDNTLTTFSTINLPANTLNLNTGWRVIVSIGGEDTVYALRQPAIP